MDQPDPIQKAISIAIKVCLAILAILLLLAVIQIQVNTKPPEEVAKMIQEMKDRRAAIIAGRSINPNVPDNWPPKMNKDYPNFSLIDQEGQAFTLQSLKGKIVIVEYIDFLSPVSQAQSGAGLVGAYGSMAEVDELAVSFADALKKNTIEHLTLPKKDLIELKVIVYGTNGAQGTVHDAQEWADHFDLKRSDNIIVAVLEKDFRSRETQSIIGGYQLLDRNGVLRADSSGATPKHNLGLTLVPLVAKLLEK